MRNAAKRDVSSSTNSNGPSPVVSIDALKTKPSHIECPTLRALWRYLSGGASGAANEEQKLMLRSFQECIADPDRGMSSYWAALPEAQAQAIASATGNGVLVIPLLVFNRMVVE